MKKKNILKSFYERNDDGIHIIRSILDKSNITYELSTFKKELL